MSRNNNSFPEISDFLRSVYSMEHKHFLEMFGHLRKPSDIVVSSSKILALSGEKSHAFESEKNGRYDINA